MAAWKRRALWYFFYQKTIQLGHLGAVKYMLRLRYHFQKQLAVYSKRHTTFDELQHNAIKNLELMMKWCKGYYLPYAAKEAITQNTDLATRPRKVKSIINGEWEKLVKRSSY